VLGQTLVAQDATVAAVYDRRQKAAGNGPTNVAFDEGEKPRRAVCRSTANLYVTVVKAEVRISGLRRACAVQAQMSATRNARAAS
jgi:hypothetical protein